MFRLKAKVAEHAIIDLIPRYRCNDNYVSTDLDPDEFRLPTPGAACTMCADPGTTVRNQRSTELCLVCFNPMWERPISIRSSIPNSCGCCCTCDELYTVIYHSPVHGAPGLPSPGLQTSTIGHEESTLGLQSRYASCHKWHPLGMRVVALPWKEWTVKHDPNCDQECAMCYGAFGHSAAVYA